MLPPLVPSVITFVAAMLLAIVAGLGDWSATALLGGVAIVGVLFMALLWRADHTPHGR